MNNFAVIFDMDGVLIDSVKFNWQAMNEVLSEYDVHIDDDQLRYYIGQSLVAQVKQISDAYDVRLDYETIRDNVAPIKTRLLENIPPKEGVIALLELLQAHNIPIAVGTSSNREHTERKLTEAGIRQFFDVLVTEDDVSDHKPNPKVYQLAAEKLGVDVSHCIVFEDAPSGIDAAKKAGMKCVAVATSYTNDYDLSDADIIIPTLDELELRTLTDLLADYGTEKRY